MRALLTFCGMLIILCIAVFAFKVGDAVTSEHVSMMIGGINATLGALGVVGGLAGGVLGAFAIWRVVRKMFPTREAAPVAQPQLDMYPVRDSQESEWARLNAPVTEDASLYLPQRGQRRALVRYSMDAQDPYADSHT